MDSGGSDQAQQQQQQQHKSRAPTASVSPFLSSPNSDAGLHGTPAHTTSSSSSSGGGLGVTQRSVVVLASLEALALELTSFPTTTRVRMRVGAAGVVSPAGQLFQAGQLASRCVDCVFVLFVVLVSSCVRTQGRGLRYQVPNWRLPFIPLHLRTCGALLSPSFKNMWGAMSTVSILCLLCRCHVIACGKGKTLPGSRRNSIRTTPPTQTTRTCLIFPKPFTCRIQGLNSLYDILVHAVQHTHTLSSHDAALHTLFALS